MNANISRVLCLVCLATLIPAAAACAGPEPTATRPPVPIVQVVPSEGEGAVEKHPIFTEQIDQNNCGNNRDLPHPVERSQTIAYTMEVGGGVKVNASGKISGGLPAEVAKVEVSVGAEVATHYGVSYGKEETLARSLTLITEAGTRKQYDIQHLELWETGELVITIGEWEGRFPFQFRRGFGLEQVGIRYLDCPTPTVEPTDTPPPEPTLTPTRRPPTATPTLQPEESGWHLYDDFTAPDPLDTNWWLNDENQICTLNVSEGHLSFDCSNETAADHGAALHPSHPSDTLTGIAVTVSVEKIGGPFQLVTSWECDADGSRRDYHLELDIDAVRAVEFYPQENWRVVPLGEVAVTSDKAHVLQMERTSDSMGFSVDGQPLPLDTVPELPACFSPNYWSFDFWVWKDGNRLKGQIDQVSEQSTDAPVSSSPTVAVPFSDDFNSRTINTSKWDTSLLQYASAENGHLYFDTPINETAKWVGYEIKARVETISRIMFTVKLDTPPGPDLGWLVLGTSCSSDPGWMGAYAGGPEGRFVVQYAPKGEDEGDKIYFEPVADGRSHTVDLRWVGDGVQVYIDEHLQDEIIPCEGPAWYANFGAGLNPNTKVSGYFDDIAIWP